MTTLRLLFTEPFDPAAINIAVGDDYDNFEKAAFFFLGYRENWLAALDQADRLISFYEEHSLDDRYIWRVVSLLVDRAGTFDDTGALLDILVERLQILPGTGLFEEIAMANLHKTDPQAWAKKNYREWAEGRRAARETFAAARVAL